MIVPFSHERFVSSSYTPAHRRSWAMFSVIALTCDVEFQGRTWCYTSGGLMVRRHLADGDSV